VKVKIKREDGTWVGGEVIGILMYLLKNSYQIMACSREMGNNDRIKL